MVVGNELHATSLSLHHSIKSRLGFILDRPNLALCCAALDPRYGNLSFISDNLRDQVWDTLAKWLIEYEDVRPQDCDDKQECDALPLPALSPTRMTYEQISGELLRFRRLFEDVEQYQRLKEVRDPLQYWHAAFQSRPNSMVLKFLIQCLYCIPASSASSERVFSKTGLQMPRLRARMMPDTLEDLVLMSEWSKQSMFNYDDLLDDYVEMLISEKGENND